jgi:ElaB/YqjD/DUF883 family membrane-anchored ribosome-binding protein
MNGVATKAIPEKLEARLHDAREASVKKMEHLADGVEQAMLQANRNARRLRHAAEDSLDNARHQVKQNPIAAIGVAAVAGLIIGLLSGAYIRGKRCSE